MRCLYLSAVVAGMGRLDDAMSFMKKRSETWPKEAGQCCAMPCLERPTASFTRLRQRTCTRFCTPIVGGTWLFCTLLCRCCRPSVLPVWATLGTQKVATSSLRLPSLTQLDRRVRDVHRKKRGGGGAGGS